MIRTDDWLRTLTTLGFSALPTNARWPDSLIMQHRETGLILTIPHRPPTVAPIRILAGLRQLRNYGIASNGRVRSILENQVNDSPRNEV